ncbi:hypothetical protein C8J56DRAFT_979351 [Mycena floridula]|nr:hypothetical protein C8J56DRAFT_979351 [Mycena floridula]
MLRLPPELWPEILVHLPSITLLRCTQVCKVLKDTIETVAELQFIIELALDGLEIRLDAGNISHPERIKSLQRARKAWATLSSSGTHRIVLPPSCLAYELVGGVFVKVRNSEFSILSLPSPSVEQGHLVQRSMAQDESTIRDFAIDPTQNLLALFESEGNIMIPTTRRLRIRLMTLSSLSSHPDARYPALRFSLHTDQPLGNLISSVFVQIAQDTLALYIRIRVNRDDGRRLLIWNWKYGAVLADLDNDRLPVKNFDFSLISPSAFIMTSIGWPGCIEIFSFDSTSEGPVHLVATLSMPELLSSNIKVHSLTTHCSPIYANPPSWCSIDPALRIHVISVDYMNEAEQQTSSYSLFVRNSTFLSFVDAYSADTPTRKLWPIRIPWLIWAPDKTRFFQAPLSYFWMRYVHGQRVLMPFDPDAQGGLLDMLDFSAAAVHRNLEDLEDQDEANVLVDIVSGQTCIHASDTFRGDLYTALPYRRVTRRVSEEFTGFMIDQDRLIGIKESETQEELHVSVF